MESICLKLKNTIFFLFCILLFCTKSVLAQDPNGELRSLFTPLVKPAMHAPFLFEMVGHCTDEKWFDDYNTTDTNNWNNWYNVYDEMKFSAYNVNLLPNTLDLLHKAEKTITKDTIPIGIINLDFDILVDSAFAVEGEYFTWDDDNIYDVSNRTNSPYEWKSVFLGSPLVQTSDFRDVTFKISPDFIFHNSNYRFGNGAIDIESLYIDFGDGNGWQYFDHTIEQTYQVTYPRNGEYLIKFAIFQCDPYPNCGTSPIKYSQSYIEILKDELIKAPDAYLEIPGLDVAKYIGCDPTSGKKLIYLEGIDFNDSKNVHKIYSEMFENNDYRLKSLNAFNYDIYIVSWERSRIDVRENAMSVVKLIEELKKTIDVNNNEQFVIIGESMGGLIARLALNYMESDEYKVYHNPIPYEPTGEESLPINLDYNNTELMHNTRLFISLDAPQQGAYIPVSAQHAMNRIKELEYRYPALYNNGYYFPIIMMIDRCKKYYNELLQSKATKQMLIYHINGWNQLTGLNTYTTLTDKDQLYNTINAYKPNNMGMPEFCKNMTISSGLLTGQRQTNYDGNFLPANYNIATVDLDFRKRYFRLIEKKIMKLHMELKGLPEINTSGTVFNFHAELNKFTLKGCLRKLFGRNTNCGNYPDPYDEIITPSNVIPFDVVAGGSLNIFWQMTNNQFKSGLLDWFIFSYKYTINPSIGSVTGDFSYGIITPKFITFNMSTDALKFNFIPVRSAVNYMPSNYNNWETDLYAFNNSQIFSRTKFDLITGSRRTNKNPFEINGGHVAFNNNQIPNTSLPHEKILQLEIGDGNLYLDNFHLNRNSKLQINYNINLGIKNPFYEYVKPSGGSALFDNFISNNKPLVIENSFSTNLYYENNLSVDLSNCLNCILNSGYFEFQAPLPYCSAMQKTTIIDKEENSSNNSDSFKIYPNPSSDIFHIEMSDNIKYDYVIIRNSIGSEIRKLKIINSIFDLDLSEYPSGIYNVNFINSTLNNSKSIVLSK